MDRWLYKMENKLGKYCVKNLMLVLCVGQGMVYLANLFAPAFGIAEKMSLVWSAVMQGQVWRIFTFLFVPEAGSNVLFLLLSLYFYYFIGSALQNEWGDFKFNFYYLCGALGAVLSAVLTGYATTAYLNLSLFFAFAMLYPNQELLLFFILPVKIKYLAYIDAGLMAITFLFGAWYARACILLALVNFLLFFGPDIWRGARNRARYAKTRREWQRNNRGRWQ